MLVKFGAKNFFSIKDWQWIDLGVPSRATDDRRRFTVSQMKTRLVRVLGLFGPNASGKTNLLKIPSFINYFVADSFLAETDALIPVEAFGFGTLENPASRFKLVFQNEGSEGPYEATYELEVTEEEVLHESLVFSNKEMGFFIREPNQLKTSGIFRLGGRDPVRKKIRKNASVISTLAQFDHPASEAFKGLFKGGSSNVGLWGKVSPRDDFGAAEFLNQDEKCRSYLEKFLRWSDPMIDGIRFESIKVPNTDSPRTDEEKTFPWFKHRLFENEFSLLLASQGTQRLFRALPDLIIALENGTFAFLDELDMDLHPHLFNRLLEMFVNEKTNPQNAQLIFAAHNPYSLSLMEKEEICFVDRDNEGASHCYRLSDIEGIRRNENFLAKYLAGEYGAIPKL